MARTRRPASAFVRRTIAFKDALTPEPAVANVRLVDLDGDGRLDLLACDMRQGVVLQAQPDHPEAGAVAIAQIPNPDHVAVVDLDKDGRNDLLVSDLGGFFPGDHERGSVTWLRALSGGRRRLPLAVNQSPVASRPGPRSR